MAYFRPPYQLNDFYQGVQPNSPFDPNYDRYEASIRRQNAADALRQEGIAGGRLGGGPSYNWGSTQMSARAPMYSQQYDQATIDQMLGGGQVYPMGAVRPTPGNMPSQQGQTYGAPTQQLGPRPQPQAPAPTPIRDNRQEINQLQRGAEDPRQAQRIQYLQRQNQATRLANQNPQFAQNRAAIQQIQDRMAGGKLGANQMQRAQANIARMRTENRGFRNG